MTPNPPLARYAWAVLVYNIFVVLWGSLVRATGSGAGCGAHWPLCNGQIVPVLPQMHTAIEFTHRATSGIALLTVVALYFWARRTYEKTAQPRRAAFFALIFMINETLVGALLVLLGLVAGSRSPYRPLVLALHLINTLLLLGAITLTAWFASHPEPVSFASRWGRLTRLAIGVVLLLTAAGGVAALGDTLFPAASLQSGLQDDFTRSAPLLVQLRVVHPILAVLGGAFLLWLVFQGLEGNPAPMLQRWGYLVGGCVLAQFGLGSMNIILLTPLWTQLLHLLVTDILWVSLIVFSAVLLADSRT